MCLLQIIMFESPTELHAVVMG